MLSTMGSSRSRILPEDTAKRRRWVIGAIVLLFFVVFLATGSHYRNNYDDVAYPRPPPPPHGPHGPQHNSPHLGDSNALETKQFRKPPGTKLIGLVFFGRTNRVEIMRCFLEVSYQPQILACSLLRYSAISWTMVDGLTKCIGFKIPIRRQI